METSAQNGTGPRLDADTAFPPELRPLFTEDLLAEYLRVSSRTIRKWRKQGRLRSYKIDGCRRFDPQDVDAFLAEHREGDST